MEWTWPAHAGLSLNPRPGGEKVTLDGQHEAVCGGRIETQCMKAVCDSGNQSDRFRLRWRKAGLDLVAHSSIAHP